MMTSLKRYLRVLLWVWFLGGLALGLLAVMDPGLKKWLVAAAEQMSG